MLVKYMGMPLKEVEQMEYKKMEYCLAGLRYLQEEEKKNYEKAKK